MKNCRITSLNQNPKPNQIRSIIRDIIISRLSPRYLHRIINSCRHDISDSVGYSGRLDCCLTALTRQTNHISSLNCEFVINARRDTRGDDVRLVCDPSGEKYPCVCALIVVDLVVLNGPSSIGCSVCPRHTDLVFTCATFFS